MSASRAPRALYHGTSYSSLSAIRREGLRPGSHLASKMGIAIEYAEVASEVAGASPPPRGVSGVVIEVVGIPSIWLRHDAKAMAEPVAPPGLTGAAMDRRARRALDEYRRAHPESYWRVSRTIGVDPRHFSVSLAAVFSVICAERVPPAMLARVWLVRDGRCEAWEPAGEGP